MPKSKKVYRCFVYGHPNNGIQFDTYNDEFDENYLIDIVDFNDRRTAESFCRKSVKNGLRGLTYKNLNKRGKIKFIDLLYGLPDYSSDSGIKDIELSTCFGSENGEFVEFSNID